MRNTICACMFLCIIMAYAAVYAQQQEKLTISTYYPAPNAVYQTMRLKPSNNPPGNAQPGQLYYNSSDIIMYYNLTGSWKGLVGGSGASDTWDFIPFDAFPGCATKGDIFFNNTTGTIQARNMTNQWANLNSSGYWQESNYISGPPAHYDVYLVNHTKRQFGIGANILDMPLDIQNYVNSSDDKDGKSASFIKYLDNKGTSQELFISTFPPGTSKTYLNNTDVIAVPNGHLKFAVSDAAKSLVFINGGYYDPKYEVMHLNNPTGETYPSNYSVVIGNTTSPFPFTVDTNYYVYSQDPAFAVRGVQNGRKTGTFQISNWGWTADWAYGCIFQEGAWKNDPYTLTDGTTNHYYLKFLQDRYGSAQWFCGSTVYTRDEIDWSGATGGFDKAFNGGNGVTLWNTDGQWEGRESLSSRTIKENFVALDLDKVLQKIDRLEVTRWNYIDQDYVTHIGPVAEDFYRLFKMGGNDQITLIDSIGVSLAGVKALIREANAQQKEIEGLRSRLAAIKSKLSPSR